jgi:DNA-binding CsgD family transcriptional regulator
MVKTSIERLTARHRECLQLVASNHSTKEIALSLKISPNTVDGYISEAKEILGASSRRDAARIFRQCGDDPPPQSLRGDFSRVASSDESLSIPLGDAEDHPRGVARPLDGLRPTLSGLPSKDVPFHWFRGKKEHNTLTPGQRMMWIAIASVAAAIAFLAALNIIDTLARLLSH